MVYAASSLEAYVNRVCDRYREQYPKRDLRIILQGSQQSRVQLERGAPPGVFISASKVHIDSLTDLGLIESSEALADNQLSIVSRPSSPVETLNQLANTPRVGLADPRVPLGEITWKSIRQNEQNIPGLSNRIKQRLLSLELNARALSARVFRQEVNAAILYYTDAIRLEEWVHTPLTNPQGDPFLAHYFIALTREHSSLTASGEARDWFRIAQDHSSKNHLKELGFHPTR